jgi:VanZ family protein
MVIILYFSLTYMPAPSNLWLPYLVHFFEYGFLVFLLTLALGQKQPITLFWTGFTVIFLSSGYGLLIEIIQFFIPYRSFSLGDFLANLAGSIAAYAIYIFWQAR